jgi:hypothetical protein
VTGKNIKNVRVIAQPEASGTPAKLTQSTDSGGFELTGLPFGKYSLCVDDPSSEFLDPCFWGTNSKIELKTGQSVFDRSLTIERGTTLRVRILDPQKLTANGDAADIIVAILRPNGRLQPLRLTQSDAAGKTYSLAVPPVNHALFISSNRLTFSDEQDVSIVAKPKGKGLEPPFVNIAIPANAKNHQVTLKVSGKR